MDVGGHNHLPSAEPSAPRACANCGTVLHGRYCSVCGQQADTAAHSVGHFLWEAVEALTHADSRVRSTLPPLLRRPGFLTREFFAGRRARYVQPLRLYLIVSVVFFLLSSLLHSAPHVTTVFEADMSAVLEDRARRREEFTRRGVPLTLTAYFVQATVAAIRVVPEANSRWTDAALEIYDAIHIGVGTAVEGKGLVVPMLRDAHARDLFETARGLDDLVSRARAGKLAPVDVRGGTFSISNHGVSGSLLAAPIIINQPQSAILGIGKLERRAVVTGEGDTE